MYIIVELGVDVGIMIYLVFLVDVLIKGEEVRIFLNLVEYVKIYCLEIDVVCMNFMLIEWVYCVMILEVEVVYVI